MPSRPRPPKKDRATRVAEKIEQIARISPTTGELFQDWIDRLLAGEPIEDLKPEMDRVAALFKKHGRR